MKMTRYIAGLLLAAGLAVLSSGCAMSAISHWASSRKIVAGDRDNRVLQAFFNENALVLKVSFKPHGPGSIFWSESPIYWVKIPLEKKAGRLEVDPFFQGTHTKFQRSNPIWFNSNYHEIKTISLTRMPDQRIEFEQDGATVSHKVENYPAKLREAKIQYKKELKSAFSKEEGVFLLDYLISSNGFEYRVLLCYKDEENERRALEIAIREPYDAPSALEYTASAILLPVAAVEVVLAALFVLPVVGTTGGMMTDRP